MKFKKSTINLMKPFLEHFNTFCDTRTPLTQEGTDSILSLIYSDIRASYRYIDSIYKSKKLAKSVGNICCVDDIPKTHLLHNKLIPLDVKLHIKNMAVGYFKVKVCVWNINVNIYFLMFNKSEFNNLKLIEKKIRQILIILSFCSLYMKTALIKHINLFLYLTNIDKKIPKNFLAVLGNKHCNSVITLICPEKVELLIFRNEEWQKVLINELFRCMCLDFSGLDYCQLKKDVKMLFNVESTFEISRSYTEFWATIINSCMISYNLLDKKEDKESFLLYSEFCIQFEKIFSLFQCVKILHYMGLKYSNLYKNDDVSISLRKLLYKENTHISAYYIIKVILLLNHDRYLQWCLINNSNLIAFDKSPLTFKKFGEFIKIHYNSSNFIKKIEKVEALFYKLQVRYIRSEKNAIIKTSRMTICEID